MISHEADDTAHFIPTSYLFHKKRKEGGRREEKDRWRDWGIFFPAEMKQEDVFHIL